MSILNSTDFMSFDGNILKIHQMGSGRPILLLHGLFSSAEMNWIKFGHAQALCNAGFHVVMPDFRAHGQSSAPHDPAAYPNDVLVQDILCLLDYFAWDDYDLAGFSLGARTTAKLLTNGVKPNRAILTGMGWQGLSGWDGRRQFFIDAIDKRETVKRGDAHWFAVQFMKSQKIDPIAARLLLNSFGSMDVDALLKIDLPMAVICGRDDDDNGSAPLLAEKLSNAIYYEISGTHMSSVVETDLSGKMIEFLQQT
ncbi:alpha/beta hydrolase [Sphingorhabdus lutea]|uniref:Alpha/beta hydrolase n=1 Tax=Sphingorhabdus lutea TaxID=1913578 RepID=A0A1L3JCJ0_9SPHN|nr:alpha/beta fold hydrolase [Sphingorhabdus lutea]APG62773.1 alpha/beta hydrolase [Sphingorhabdus lutea]